jgi:hypothetical protein
MKAQKTFSNIRTKTSLSAKRYHLSPFMIVCLNIPRTLQKFFLLFVLVFPETSVSSETVKETFRNGKGSWNCLKQLQNHVNGTFKLQ